MKAINRGGDNPKAIFTEEIHVGSAHLAIKSLTIVRPNGEPPKLLIVTHDFIHAIPLYRCSKVLSCRSVNIGYYQLRIVFDTWFTDSMPLF